MFWVRYLFSGYSYSIYFYFLNPKQTFFCCNCRNKVNCPLSGGCLTPNIIYRIDIITDCDHHFYYGTSETTPQESFSSNIKYQHSVKLTKYIWQLKTISIVVLSGRFPEKYVVILTNYHANFV